MEIRQNVSASPPQCETSSADFLDLYPYTAMIPSINIEPLISGLMLGIIAVYLYKYRKSAEVVSHWGGVALTFCLISICTPFAQKHYLVFLVPAFLYLVHVWYQLELHDRWFHELVLAAATCLIFTNEAICGEYL